ncbi:hypothetical protein D1610_14155 [Sphingomonas gilva]|uniref:TonB-dependent receptor plug domain-containing protein n=1 Tax=Sphingomonas gilva TaxID=2305907 RepID=A0A396RT90_9SPHN|nr:TonB-dependent receptor plug domain-containing protein [Sphingomonas gilva]RHW16851.1 hypothetical protein D1610_14155 [Sphingomonas gilva]
MMGNRLCRALGASTAIGMVCAATAASAQSAVEYPQDASVGQDEQAQAEDIIVTGSRVVTNGNQSANPVTVLSTDELLRNTPTTIADALSQAPQFRGSLRPSSFVSPQSPVNAFVNLRGLSDPGTPRTLVLFDGRRVTPAIAGGQVDVNMLPNLLVKRVDIVTGGASAAYGSDAVAGVVNYILDRDFVGLKASANAGVSQRGDNGTQKIGLAAGGKFLDDRLHVMGSLEYFNSSGVGNTSDRAWLQKHCQAIQNPTYSATNSAGGPNFLFRCGVTGTDFARGGVITSGPLQGTQFLPGGATAPYRYGTLRTASTMVGGDGEWLPRGNVVAPLKTISGFGHIDYDVTDNIRLFVEGTYTRNESDLPFIYPQFSGGSAFAIRADNAFLPNSVRGQMATLGLATISVGRVGLDWGQSVGHTTQDYYRGAAGFDAKLGGDWVLSGYFDWGRALIDQNTTQMVNVANARLAADAVVNPANGQIACRSTLTNPANGCVPLNIFGEGSASQAALDYIFGEPFTHRKTEQSAAELAVRGSPFATWAGDVQLAAGFDWREISASAVADSISTSGGWLAGNQVAQPYGKYNVKEVFGEVTIHEGYVTRKEARRIEKGEAPDTGQKPARPEVTATMQTYIDLHRHAAVRAALTGHPKVALRLLVAHAIVGSHLFRVTPEPQSTRNDGVRESVETCRGEAEFDERRRAVLGLLGFSAEEATVTGGNCDGYRLAGVFLRLLDLPDRAVMDVIAIVIGEALAAGGAAVEAVGSHIGVDMAQWWQADAAFFELIRDKEVLGRIVAEVAGEAVASANAGEKSKTLKEIVADHLAGANGRAKVENWVPKWMAFPPAGYTARGGVGTVKAAALVAAARATEPDPTAPASALLPEEAEKLAA